MALGWIAPTSALASVVRNPNSWCSPLDRIGFRAAASVPSRPDAGEERQRAFVVECKPGRCLVRLGVRVFATGIKRHNAAVSHIEPSAPVRLAVLRMLVIGALPN
jgi:hypothetical protein